MKPFELIYLCAEPFLPPLHREVRRRMIAAAKTRRSGADILDVGGRKSHYTIGVPASVTITDLPRETEIQHRLNLGINDGIAAQTRARRSNVRAVLFDDMTHSALPSDSFDCVVSVEVLEHVEEDADFVREVHRVLKPGGVFLMTTPNGDSIPQPYPDHRRHYTRAQLHALLSSCFDQVEVEYAIRGGLYRRLGLKSWSVRRPRQTVLSMVGNVVNTFQSAGEATKKLAVGTHHLIARAEKAEKRA
ncbi:MAG: class I SAM-dependent methyltransferase [Pyrinomonadaceae bacterium]